MFDRKGPFIPLLYHHGDAGIELRKDSGYLAATMDVAASEGQHGFRWWLALLPPFWEHFILTADDLVQMQDMARERGLKLLLDGGDLFDCSRDDRRRVQQTILDVGDREVIMSIRAANEGNRHRIDPREFADWIQPFTEKWPDLMLGCTTGGAGEELTDHSKTAKDGRPIDGYTDHHNMDRWNPPPSNVVGKHGYRDGTIVDKARHCFSWTYELKPRTRITIDDEPPGVSDFVSVIDNQHEMTPEGCALISAVSHIGRCPWVFFPGIEKRTQPLSDFVPHLRKLREVAEFLPADLYAYDDLEHGGDSQGKRVFEVTDPGRKRARADHALKGRELYVVACYDDAGHSGYRQRKGSIEGELKLAPWGKLFKGRQ